MLGAVAVAILAAGDSAPGQPVGGPGHLCRDLLVTVDACGIVHDIGFSKANGCESEERDNADKADEIFHSFLPFCVAQVRAVVVLPEVREDLSLLKPDPDLFTFSALYNLFRAQEEKPTFGGLPPRDQARKAQWDGETDFRAFSDQETAKFEAFFDRKVTGDRGIRRKAGGWSQRLLPWIGTRQWPDDSGRIGSCSRNRG